MPSLATLLYALYSLTEDIQYGARCAETSYEIFANSNYPHTAKLQAAAYFALVAGSLTLKEDLRKYLQDGPFAKTSFDQALTLSLELVDEMLSENFTRSQQLAQMRKFHSYPVLCAWSSQVAKKQTQDIVRTYERGRNIIFTRLLNKRTPIEDLKEKWPELSNRYLDLSQQLTEPGNDKVFKNQPKDKFELESQLRWVYLKLYISCSNAKVISGRYQA